MLRGELTPGTRLRQDELAADLGVSKIPVREALQRLAAAGLLTFASNRGASVPMLTADDAVENYALRRAIEPLLLKQALPLLTVVDLAEAEMALTDATLSTTEANWAFHRALYNASGWTRGLAIAEMLHASVAPYVRLYTEQLGGAADSNTEHQDLLTSCRQGDADTASALLETHLVHAQEALRGFLTSQHKES